MKLRDRCVAVGAVFRSWCAVANSVSAFWLLGIIVLEELIVTKMFHGFPPLWNLKVHYRLQKWQPLFGLILNQLNPFQIFTPCTSEINFCVILQFTSVSFRFCHQKCVHYSRPVHPICYLSTQIISRLSESYKLWSRALHNFLQFFIIQVFSLSSVVIRTTIFFCCCCV